MLLNMVYWKTATSTQWAGKRKYEYRIQKSQILDQRENLRETNKKLDFMLDLFPKIIWKDNNLAPNVKGSMHKSVYTFYS